MEGIVDLINKLCSETEIVNEFCCLGDELNASSGCKPTVTARIKIGWIRFRECGELSLGKMFSLKIKGKIYRCCLRSAILQGGPKVGIPLLKVGLRSKSRFVVFM